MRIYWKLSLATTIVLVALAAEPVGADAIGTYVDATLTNTVGTINPWDTPDWAPGDNLWQNRIDKNSVGWISSLYEGEHTESNLLTTTVTIPEAGSYDIYAVYTASLDPYPGWGIAAALSGETLVRHDYASGNLGLATGDKQEGADHLEVYGAHVGMIEVDAGGSVSVDVDTLMNTGGSDRTWYHGVAYAPVPEMPFGAYVDATPSNTVGTIDPWDTPDWTPGDNLWQNRIDKNSVSWISSLYEGEHTESNLLTTTVTIPDAGTYDIYAVYTASLDPYPGWGIAAALSGEALVRHDYASENLGVATGFKQEGADHLEVYGAPVGTVTVDAGGSVSVDVDTLMNTGGSDRTWYHGIAFTLSDEPTLEGDLNSDGFVGGDDLDIVRSFWGQTVPSGDLLQGDPSGDGFVGGDDLDIVRANWGQGTPPAPGAVPEPGTLVLLGTALLLLQARRRLPSV